jgi:hypothetical protein
MDRGEVPGYEFEVPRGPRHASGPRYEIESDQTREFPREQFQFPVEQPQFEREEFQFPREQFRYPRERPQFPGDQFEFPREQPREFPRDQSQFWREQPQSRREQFQFQREEPEQEPRPSMRNAGSGVLAVMRKRNWLMGVAAPILAAMVVGIAVVVVTGGGGNGGAAPSALAAGFPPARLAAASFTGDAATSQVVLSAIGASDGTEVAAGSVNGGPAVWDSSDGGDSFTRATLGGLTSMTKAGTGQLAGVAHGAAGWLAVGTTLAGAGGPLVVSSPDGHTWTVTGGIAKAGGRGTAAAAVAAGSAGYVIVGHEAAGNSGASVAAAWYAPGLTEFQSATVTQQDQAGTAGGQTMNAVTAMAHGFVAVGATGTGPSVWVSAAGRTWQQVAVPMPADAARAALSYVAANGSSVVAAGTEFSAGGVSSPFAEVSADSGTTWTPVLLTVPAIGSGTGTTVTALTAAGGGFTAVGTYASTAGPEVVVWTLPPGSPVTAAWTAVTPQGTGLASTTSENTITALTAEGTTLTGVGFTATLTATGTATAQKPTLWQSPIRY